MARPGARELAEPSRTRWEQGGNAIYAKLFARDLGFVTGAALLWRFGSGFSAGPGAVADFTGVLVGLVLGVCALPLHEWGHLLGALLARSHVRPGESLRGIFVFSFDSQRNSKRHFLVMSLGGWLGTAAAVWVAYGLLPSDLLAARVARGLVLLSVLLVAVTEVPLLARAFWTGRVPRVEVGGSGRAGPAPASAPGRGTP